MLPLIQTGGGVSGTLPSTIAKVASKWLDSYSSVTGLFTQTQPAFSDISGKAGLAQGGTNVDLSASGSATAILAQDGSHVISARALVGADLPNPSASTLGGVQSLAVVASKWINTISTAGVPAATQPAFTDISGSLASTQLPTSLFTRACLLPANRAVGVVFQNTSGKDMIVCGVFSGNATPSAAQALIGASNPPTSVVGQVTSQSGFAFELKFVVPNNFFYEVVQTTATVTTASWTEYLIVSGNVTISADLSGTRVLGTAVQNTSGFAKLIMVMLTTVTGTTTGAPMQGLCDTSNPPTTQIFGIGQPSTGFMTMYLLVPNNSFYKFTATTGSIAHWWEVTLPFNAVQSLNLQSTANSATNGTFRQISSATAFITYLANTYKDLWIHATQAPSATSSSLLYCGNFSGIGAVAPSALVIVGQQSNATANSQNVSGLALMGDGYILRSDGVPTLQQWFEYKLG